MKPTGWKALLVIGAPALALSAVAIVLLTASPARTPARTPARDSPTTSAPPERVPAAAPSILDELRAAARRDAGMAPLAARLQAACRSDLELVRALAALLLDPAEPAHAREVAAFVLGTLANPEGRQAIARALAAGGSAAWVRTLVLAAGVAPDPGHDHGFEYEDAPYIHRTASRLRVEIRAVVTDPALREAVLAQFRHAEPEVRRAVVEALQHTLAAEGAALAQGGTPDGGGLRDAFLRRMSDDPDEPVRAGAGRALGEWIHRAPPSDPAYALVTDEVLRRGRLPEEDQLRFRVLAAMKDAALREDQLARLLESAERSGSLEPRAWALEVAGGQAGRIGPDRLAATIGSVLRDPDAKLREAAVRQIRHLPGGEVALALTSSALRDPAWHVRYAAVQSLARQPAGPELLRALDEVVRLDIHEEVRRLARATMESLQRK